MHVRGLAHCRVVLKREGNHGVVELREDVSSIPQE